MTTFALWLAFGIALFSDRNKSWMLVFVIWIGLLSSCTDTLVR